VNGEWGGGWLGGWVVKVDWKGGWCVKNHMAGQLVHFSFWLASVVPIFL